MTRFGSSNNSTCKRVLDLLELGYLRFREVVIESCSSQVWSKRWRWQWYWLFSNQGMGEYSEADECDNSRIWKEMKSGLRR